MTTWLEHVKKWGDCQRCPLGQQRSLICLARSEWPAGAAMPNLRLPCDIAFVGEAPGMSEDAFGLPFVGPAGDLLNTIIHRALLGDTTTAFTNLVACYPRHAKETGDHRPERGEILECRQRLVEFVNLAQPRLIVRVGSLVQEYLNFDRSVSFVDIVHPAYILARMAPAQKSGAANDCSVKLRNAWHKVLQSPKQPWKKWETVYAASETKTGEYWDDEEIAF